MSNQANQNENLMNVNVKDILKDYQDQASELVFQSYIKDEQIKNLQTKLKELQAKLKELQAPKSAKEAKNK